MDVDAMIGEAQDLRSQDEHEKACEVLRRLIDGGYDKAAIHALLGDSRACLGQWEDATRSFERGVQLVPRSGNASFGLFHCLWDRGMIVEALEEALRYLRAGGKPKRYEELIHGMAQPKDMAVIERWVQTHRPDNHEEVLRRFKEQLAETQRLL